MRGGPSGKTVDPHEQDAGQDPHQVAGQNWIPKERDIPVWLQILKRKNQSQRPTKG